MPSPVSKTSSINLASFLIARQVPYLYSEPSPDGRTVLFCFEIDEPQLLALQGAFINNTPVPGYALLEAHKRLKRTVAATLGKGLVR